MPEHLIESDDEPERYIVRTARFFVGEGFHPVTDREHARLFTRAELADPVMKDRSIACIGHGAEPYRIRFTQVG